ncbi:hypothetical protein K440DRAFT_607103 [Wilcoxina mikolae CBS 423.85]|nr:hypothetical protein K440DRAFT_607103 [Wilcoxina mikolae CBS 423.85]
MRASLRLLTARLPPFTATGITGLLTHPHPRPTLIALYNHTLNVLSTLPPHSVYRQSAENLTKQRLEIVKALTAEQVEEIEDKIGEGLIEEVIEEGWGELRCAEAMKDHKVWEPLEVIPDEGQWAAFERTTPVGAGPA